MNEEEAKRILMELSTFDYVKLENGDVAIETVLNLLEKKDEIINNAIIEIENLRQYFSEDLQPDFIRILEILKDKKVIDW